MKIRYFEMRNPNAVKIQLAVAVLVQLLVQLSCPRTKVFEPITVVRELPAPWARVVIDPNELASLRAEGWTLSRLQERYRCGQVKFILK